MTNEYHNQVEECIEALEPALKQQALRFGIFVVIAALIQVLAAALHEDSKLHGPDVAVGAIEKLKRMTLNERH